MSVNLPYLGGDLDSPPITLNLVGEAFDARCTPPSAAVTAGVFVDGDTQVNIQGDATVEEVNLTMPFSGESVELPSLPDVTLSASSIESNMFSRPNIIIDNMISDYEFTYDLRASVDSYISPPFYAAGLHVYSNPIEKIYISADTFAADLISLVATVVQKDDLLSLPLNIPLSSYGMGYIENFSIEGKADTLDYVANLSMAEYAISLSVPLNVVGNASYMTAAGFYMDTTVNSASITIDAEVVGEDSIRYSVANIDHGLADGKISIKPNNWTLCFANVPIKEDGTQHTVSSFILAELVSKYGDDVKSKIPLIVAKDPVTGEEYNFVVNESYTTPEGSYNDFKLSYSRDGVFYPVPFMIQSTSSEELSIEWSLK